MIDRSKTRGIPLNPSAAEGRSSDWNLCRGNHLGQRSCASATTGRTYGRKRSDQSTAPLQGAGRPHMDQGRQGRDQMDAAVMSDVRRERRPSPASCAGLQSRQFPAHFGDAGADQGLVADEFEGEAHQDRREGRQPWALCRVPDGRGRHPTESVRRHSAAHRGTSTAASHINRVKRSFVTRPSQAHGRGAPQ